MTKKGLLSIILASLIVASSFAGCSNKTKTTLGEVETSVVNVTDENGENVTDESGKAVTEIVAQTTSTTQTSTTVSTTANGKTNTSTTAKSSSTTTKKNSSTTQKAKNSNTTTAKESDTINIVLKKNRKASCSSPNVSLATGEVTIEKGGNYKITSETDDWHGQIIIKLKNTEKAEVKFENVKITNDSKNIIQILDSSIKSNRSFLEAEASAGTDADDEIAAVADNDKAPNVSLSFPEGTSSSFSTSANGYTGVIYNESKLTIKGKGNVTVASTRNANNCICSTKSITIKNVGITLSTAQNSSTDSLAKSSGSAKGIFSYSKVTVQSGKLNIKSNGDGVRCDRFNVEGGTVNIKSSACDGIDTDDSIIISGGTVTSVATQKYCFKVRRVNNSESKKAKGTVRSGKNDCFRINGGTVTGEGKKISSLDSAFQSDKKGSSQANITAKIVKKNTSEDSKTPSVIKISTINKQSSNAVTKFLYSSSKVNKGTAYTASANGKEAKVSWSGNFGVAEIETTANK
jgi:hypothetical protein